jgi:hypothetical protein
MNNHIILASLVSIAALACGGDDTEDFNIDEEGCEHLIEGPSTPVTGAPGTGGAPDVSTEHNRFDVTLAGETAGPFTGTVSYAAADAGDHVIFLGQDVPVALEDGDGAAIDIEESATGSPECGEIRGRHVVELAVGTAFITFGPTAETLVQVVIEHDGDHDDE